jgi:hypothetical protein
LPDTTELQYSFIYGFEKPPVIQKDTTRKSKYPKDGIFNGNIGFQAGRLIYFDNALQDYNKRFRSSVTGTFNIRIYKELTISSTFFYHIRTKDQPPLPIWLSDMFYSIKWSNWRPYTLSIGYENYADNRFNEPAKKWGEKFLQGYVFVSGNITPPKSWINKIRLDNSTNFVLVPMVRYFPTYRNEADEILNNKVIMSLSARYTIWFRLYLEAGVYAYPIPNTKMPWDPEFTYGFGYFDWRPWRVSITYGNWIANRFNFNPEIPGYNFLDGNFSILFNYRF